MLKFSEIFEFSKENSGKFLFWKNWNGSSGSNGSVPRRSNLSTQEPTARQNVREARDQRQQFEHFNREDLPFILDSVVKRLR